MLTRRKLLIAGAVSAAGLALARPAARAGRHDEYFAALQATLRREGIDRPVLLLDLERLDRNIDRLVQSMQAGTKRNYRIVVKSVPSPGLVDYIARRSGSRSGMVFHRPFIETIARLRPDFDLLLGKPMPLAAAAHFYSTHQGDFEPARQLQWLIDSAARLAQYLALAQQRGLRLRVNLEIDVGLHRGGFATAEALTPALKTIAAHPAQLEFAGFMGYDAHVGGLPGFLAKGEIPAVKARYGSFVEHLRRDFPTLATHPLTFNGAGSPTFRNYEGDTLLNDLAVGSALLKPSHFDLPVLADFEPTAFIATPVLKRGSATGLPTLEWLRGPQALWNPNTTDTVFSYGGNWLAETESPPGLEPNGIYRSSNQQGWFAHRDTVLAVDDFLFLRPTQSEAVLLQFGDLVALRGGRIEARWPVLTPGV